LDFHGIVHTAGHDTDLEAVADGYVSVTPLQLDLTHREALGRLEACYR
jgi:5'-nucleotidase